MEPFLGFGDTILFPASREYPCIDRMSLSSTVDGWICQFLASGLFLDMVDGLFLLLWVLPWVVVSHGLATRDDK
jgi:hypothetical protein